MPYNSGRWVGAFYASGSIFLAFLFATVLSGLGLRSLNCGWKCPSQPQHLAAQRKVVPQGGGRAYMNDAAAFQDGRAVGQCQREV